MGVRTAVLVSAIIVSYSASAQKAKPRPCSTDPRPETRTWHVYADPDHHFCFRYPRSYKPIAKPKAQCRGPKLHDGKTSADIYICASNDPFRLSEFVKNAPTGIDSPPEPVPIGRNTFYYYGPGGGGVSYPDGYFFNLNGKTLYISFDGPYDNDKTPSEEAKTMEKTVLESFREF